MTAEAVRLDASAARRVLFRSQCLPEGAVDPVDAVERAGFVRTLGGVDVYLALAARVGGLDRKRVDAAVAGRDLQVLPSVRGCIYLVPRSEAGWALRAADLLSRSRREREYGKSGLSAAEIDSVGEAVVELLAARGALTPAELRSELPAGVVRSLGEAGKKVGLSSNLPPTLRELELAGRVERTLEGGRLDSERYRWQVAPDSPFAGGSIPAEPGEVWAHLAGLYLRAAGIGSRDGFAAWAGIGKRAAAAALSHQDLVPVEVEGAGDLVAEPAALAADSAPGVAFLPFEDNLVHLQGGPALLVEPAFHAVPVPIWGRAGRPATLGDARHMSFRSIVVDGRLVGFWEYDPDIGRVVAGCFDPPGAAAECVAEAVAATSGFIAEELGHGRSFSLDTDDDLRRRAAQVRDLAWTAQG